MPIQKFKIRVLKKGEPVLSYDSEKEDAFKHKAKEKRIDFALKGDKFPFLENVRFDAIEITEAKGKPLVLEAIAYTKVLDNGTTKLSFKLR